MIKNLDFAAQAHSFKKWLSATNFDYPYAKRTLQAYSQTMDKFCSFLMKNAILDNDSLNALILQEFLTQAENGQKYAPASINLRTAALDLFFIYLQDQGLVEENPLTAYKALLKQRRTLGGQGGRKPQRLPAVLSFAEQDRLVDEVLPLKTLGGFRDAAIITFLLASALRAEELCQLPLAAVNLAQGSVRLIGKGNKERLVWLTPGLCETACQAWLRIRQQILTEKGLFQHPLFFITNRATALSTRGLYQQVARYMTKAQVYQARIGPHTLRHTAISLMLHQGRSLKQVQINAGHEKIQTTERYLHLIPQQ